MTGATAEQDWWHLADGDWGAGFFQNPACDWCDDVVAETADIAFGDAWVEPYSSRRPGYQRRDRPLEGDEGAGRAARGPTGGSISSPSMPSSSFGPRRPDFGTAATASPIV